MGCPKFYFTSSGSMATKEQACTEKSCCDGNAAEVGVEESMKEYYGKILQKSTDLKTNACCTSEPPADYVQDILVKINDEVTSKYYGCGLVLPEALEGTKILDLGSGSGRDCFMLSAMVGQDGFVTGIDMTDEQLEVAKRNIDYHTKIFNYTKPNVEFIKGDIRDLKDIKTDSIDIIVSNCVVNLCSEKDQVLAEAYRVLKVGGELYFSDVYSDRRILSEELQNDQTLRGECLSGALYWNDFLSLAKRAGFKDPRLVKDSEITIQNEEVQKKLAGIRFFSATFRLFKIPELDDCCEDYGQAVIYNGKIPHHPNSLKLDSHHNIEVGRVFSVCRNTHLMLYRSRFNQYFQFLGDGKTHYGIYSGCGTDIPFASAKSTSGASKGSSCC
eukprot:TRINITY_DN6680_c0_g1_i1.p1 TRINITY_DN6680_c0_g1~~TRINITY_DN6680_c0_g1_i1.p1  ORF type:complete len:386 (+),score=50.74 TRINITY_DN6680_c0_g1_i1:85-1242(+)